MTTSRAVSDSASLPIGRPSSPQSARPRDGEVVYRVFAVARPLPLAHTKSLREVVAALQANGAVAAKLPEARRNVGRAIYGDDAQTLAAMRLGAGLSQAQLAERVSTSQSLIARIERGQNDPGTDMIDRIATALGVDAGAVFVGVRAHRVAESSSQ